MLGHRTKVNWLCQTEDNKNKNINILGISESKWTRTGKFNADDHYIYYCGQESLQDMK